MIAAVITFVLKNRVLVGAGAALAAAVLTGALLMRRVERPAIAKAQAQVQAAQAVAAGAQAQTAVAQASAGAVETARTREVAILQKTESATHALQAEPDASQPVPDAVLRDWSLGIDGLRDEAAGARAPPAAAGGADAARPVSASGPN